VLAYNQDSGTTGSYTVTDVLVNLDPPQVHLTIDGELITTTPEHLFYVLLRGWVAAVALRAGDRVRTGLQAQYVVRSCSTAEPRLPATPNSIMAYLF
jgi:hypothetical protein